MFSSSSIIVYTMSVSRCTLALYIHCTYMVQTYLYTFMPGGQDFRWLWCMHCALSGTNCWAAERFGRRAAGSDFDLRKDNEAITWLKTNWHLNKMFVCWLEEIENVRFDVTHLPGSCNPTDPLSRCGFAYGGASAASTGDSDAESQQQLFLLLNNVAALTPPRRPCSMPFAPGDASSG